MASEETGQILDILHNESPSFHGHIEEGKYTADAKNWSIGEDALQWFVGNLEPNWNTLETGCGYTTVLFAAAGTNHTVVSPFESEHVSISRWCDDHDISIDKLRFVCKESQWVLPFEQQTPLDLVLIDGDHCFPAPFMDWYYVAERIRKGGLVLVDDIQVLTGRMLHDFLVAERGRWELAEQLPKTSVFRKTTNDPVIRGMNWTWQPYVNPPRDVSFMRKVKRKLTRPLRRRGWMSG